MVALPVDLHTDWGLITCSRRSNVRSYDEFGLCFSFHPEHGGNFQFALDVEDRVTWEKRSLRNSLVAVHPAHWVDVEVVAKLINKPAHIIFLEARRHSIRTLLNQNGIELLRLEICSHFISVGRKYREVISQR
ncbi:MAG: hypothetical protein AAGA28_00710 [Pseudomonadota bacterium]